MAQFIGTVEGFTFTPEADTASNSIITIGGLIGVTRTAVPAGKTGYAFFTGPKSVYTFAQAEGAAAVAQGAAVTIDRTAVGIAYDGAEEGAAEIAVLLKDPGA